eukprot:scaffold8008_cov153-Amphora_coffeaeformis.AAC.5
MSYGTIVGYGAGDGDVVGCEKLMSIDIKGFCALASSENCRGGAWLPSLTTAARNYSYGT